MKKILLVLFSIVLLFSSIPTSAYASPNAEFIKITVEYFDKYIENIETIARIPPKASLRIFLREIDKVHENLSSLGKKQRQFTSSKNQAISKVAEKLYNLNSDTINKLNNFKSNLQASYRNPDELKQAFVQTAITNFQKMTPAISGLHQVIVDIKAPSMKIRNPVEFMKHMSSTGSGMPYLISKSERSSLLKLIDNTLARSETEGTPISKFLLVSILSKMRLMLGGPPSETPNLMSLSK